MYAQDKQFSIPTAFTALNGAFQVFTVTAAVDLAVKFADESNPTDEEIKAFNLSQANLLRVLEVLRSNGAQPIVTSIDPEVDAKTVKLAVEQTWAYGYRGAPKQVSDRALKDEAKDDIADLFTNVKALKYAEGTDTIVTDDATDLFVSSDITITVGALEEGKVAEES